MIRDAAMLVTYPDSLGGNLKKLKNTLDGPLNGLFGNVHILPFFPSSGDRGFAPITYDEVDSSFGNWNDIESISSDYAIMCDFMINHISRNSEFFRDYIEKGDKSEYRDMFIRWDEFWPDGKIDPRSERILYRRKPGLPYSEECLSSGNTVKLWCTFSSQQIDLDLRSDVSRSFVEKTLINLAERGIKAIRLDAFAYGIKKHGTTCFFVEPEIWEMFDWIKGILSPYGVDILPEIHNSYEIQNKLIEHGYYVYDFSLPMLLLNALYSCSNRHIVPWLKRSPKHQFTTLDTHDGIGVIDVEGILSRDEIDFTKNAIYTKGWCVKPEYNSMLYNNLDIYQINTAYYSALGNSDEAYLLARAIQIFAPGIPQIYYVGLLAGENDLISLERTKEGRSINRHNYTREEIEEAVKRPVVQKLFMMIRMRSEKKAFAIDGNIEIKAVGNSGIEIIRENCGDKAVLTGNFETKKYSIEYYENGVMTELIS